MANKKSNRKLKPRNQPALMAGILWFIFFIFTIAARLYILMHIVFWRFVIWTIVSSIYLWGKALSSRQWEHVELIDIETGVRGLSSEWLDANLEYRYQYKGNIYTGKRVQYPFLYYKGELKHDLCVAIEAGKITHAYVNPDNPSQSVLLRGFGRGDIAFMVLIAVFFSFWGFLYYIVLTQRIL